MLEGHVRQNEIFQESSSKFLDCFTLCYYHVSMKLLEITKCYSTWKSCCFRWYHSLSKILIHIDITVHTPFCPSPLVNSSSSDDGIIHPTSCKNCWFHGFQAHSSQCIFVHYDGVKKKLECHFVILFHSRRCHNFKNMEFLWLYR